MGICGRRQPNEHVYPERRRTGRNSQRGGGGTESPIRVVSVDTGNAVVFEDNAHYYLLIFGVNSIIHETAVTDFYSSDFPEIDFSSTPKVFVIANSGEANPRWVSVGLSFYVESNKFAIMEKRATNTLGTILAVFDKVT